MEILNFEIKGNKEEIEKHLKRKFYTKIGNIQDNCKGICVLINKKTFFELSSIENKNIFKTNNMSDVIQYCI